MFDFDLPLFPVNSVAITVTTTVWVGVCVCVFFNLRLGWTLSALVVPGYIVPLIMSRPTTAVVILVESLITYLVARGISDGFRLHPYWSNVFGRDRFFVIVVVSVIVRALFDGWLLPWTGQFIVETYGWNIDYRNDLQSFGLIIVALIANYFWKPGFVRGIGPLLTCTAITYVLVSYVLVGFTNFNLGNIQLIYEDVSATLLASPKSYMIVITTAWLASWINLRYAWDFNGILIPALLGLLWPSPLKIFMSLFECVVILMFATWLMQTPLLRNRAIQGGNKLLFFFTICFLIRLIVCHCVSNFFTGVTVTDAFGTGYLLTTLMAIKAHEKKLTVRMMKGTLQVSIVGAVVGSVFGFALFCAPPINPGFAQYQATGSETPSTLVQTEDSLLELVSQAKIPLYQKRESESYEPPVYTEITTFRSALEKLDALEPGYDSFSLDEVASELGSIGYELVDVGGEHLLLREQDAVRGWGIYVITPAQEQGLCLEVPAPVSEWATVESALCLSQRFPTRAIAISGAPVETNIDGSSDPTRSSRTMFSVFHNVFGKEQPLQVRGLTNRNALRLGFIDEQGSADVLADSGFWVRGSFPDSLNLAAMKELVGDFGIFWNDSPIGNQLRKGPVFSEIFLSRDARRRLVARTVVNDREGAGPAPIEVTTQPLGEWLNEVKGRIVHAGTDQFTPATTEEMLYMDNEVLQPLISLLQMIGLNENDSDSRGSSWLSSDIRSHMRVIDCCAGVLGYQLTIINDSQTGDRYVALVERDDPEHTGKGWGTYVFRPGLVDPFAVEVPRPLLESRAFDFGVNLFERPRASALLIAGAHPRANLDGSADISKVANRTNMFNLVRHVLLRQLGARTFLISQARAIQSPVHSDIVVATDSGLTRAGFLSPLKRNLLNSLSEDGLTYEFVDGREETAGYELGMLMQATAIQISQNKEVISLWLSPVVRSKFRDADEHENFSAQFNACGVESIDGSLASVVTWQFEEAQSLESREVPGQLRERINQYVNSYDVLMLYEIVNHYQDWNFLRIRDSGSGQVYLVLRTDEKKPVAVVNMTGASGTGNLDVKAIDESTVAEFIRTRNLWMEVTSQ
ncbi:MAG: poly-gamma-glutamate biosynthesis protein PgsC/CapC [Planctomycetota bacterium]